MISTPRMSASGQARCRPIAAPPAPQNKSSTLKSDTLAPMIILLFPFQRKLGSASFTNCARKREFLQVFRDMAARAGFFALDRIAVGLPLLGLRQINCHAGDCVAHGSGPRAL